MSKGLLYELNLNIEPAPCTQKTYKSVRRALCVQTFRFSNKFVDISDRNGGSFVRYAVRFVFVSRANTI